MTPRSGAQVSAIPAADATFRRADSGCRRDPVARFEESGPERWQVHVHEHAAALDHAAGDQNRVDQTGWPAATIVPAGNTVRSSAHSRAGDSPAQMGRRV